MMNKDAYGDNYFLDFLAPESTKLPAFLKSDERWNDIICQTYTLDKFKELTNKIFNLDNNMFSHSEKMDILKDLAEDLIIAHPHYNLFWNIVVTKVQNDKI